MRNYKYITTNLTHINAAFARYSRVAVGARSARISRIITSAWHGDINAILNLEKTKVLGLARKLREVAILALASASLHGY